MPTTSNGTLHRKTEPVTPPASERRGVAHLTDCIERLRELLDELDGAVVEVMEEFEAAGTEAKRLKELRALLKDI